MQTLKRRFSRSVIEKNAPAQAFAQTKPRSLRFTFSMSSTSDRPAEDIMAEIGHVLTTNNIEFQQQESFLVVCRAEQIHFEMEVCKLPRLNMHGIRPKRIGGQALGYKNIVSKLLNDLQPFMTGAATGGSVPAAPRTPSSVKKDRPASKVVDLQGQIAEEDVLDYGEDGEQDV